MNSTQTHNDHRYVEIRIFKSGSNPKIFKMAGDNDYNNGFNISSLPQIFKGFNLILIETLKLLYRCSIFTLKFRTPTANNNSPFLP